MGGEGDSALGHRVEEADGLGEALLLPDGLEDGGEAGENLLGCKACGVVIQVSRHGLGASGRVRGINCGGEIVRRV